MRIHFSKYQANGNDFVIINETVKGPGLTEQEIARLCDRRFGIGADGLIRILPASPYDFEMKYYNADGKEASMCGNGGRSVCGEAYRLGISDKNVEFLAFDGLHKATILKSNPQKSEFYISLGMNEVDHVDAAYKYYFLDTGSPHYVEFVKQVAPMDVVTRGRKIRNSKPFAPEGVNVNFAALSGNRLFVRTYERGVEDETLSCGTGVTASAIAAYLKTGKKMHTIHTKGGDFQVDFTEEQGRFKDIFLKGPAQLVFTGTINL